MLNDCFPFDIVSRAFGFIGEHFQLKSDKTPTYDIKCGPGALLLNGPSGDTLGVCSLGKRCPS